MPMDVLHLFKISNRVLFPEMIFLPISLGNICRALMTGLSSFMNFSRLRILISYCSLLVSSLSSVRIDSNFSKD